MSGGKIVYARAQRSSTAPQVIEPRISHPLGTVPAVAHFPVAIARVAGRIKNGGQSALRRGNPPYADPRGLTASAIPFLLISSAIRRWVREPRRGKHAASADRRTAGCSAWSARASPPVFRGIDRSVRQIGDADHVGLELVQLRSHGNVRRSNFGCDIDAFVCKPVLRKHQSAHGAANDQKGDSVWWRSRSASYIRIPTVA